LADKWSLPLDLEHAIVNHHNPGSADKAVHLVNIIHLADIISHEVGCSQWDGEPHTEESASCRETLKVGDADFEKIMINVENSLEKSHEFLAVLK